MEAESPRGAGGSDAARALRVIEALEQEIAALRQAETEPIAIVGTSCRFPGADAPDELWARLLGGEESTSEVPPERWDIDALHDPDPDVPGRMTTRYGGFLRGVDLFDAAFFNVSPREATLMDPQQRLLLELTWEALERAALSPDDLYGSPTGVFVGICASDYFRLAARSADNLTAYIGTGNAPSVAAGRIAYTFGFGGPCMSIDTACSSALVAVHYACDSLRKGESNVAVAASVNLTLAPEATIAFSKARMMARDGRCKTFDERADGYVRSEGAAVVVLKKLSAARADGDRVLAVIRGSAINQDGASGGLTVPNGPAQVALIRQALARAGVRPDQIGYVETHGTGTALGDPIEVGALAEVFEGRDREQPLLLGSAKAVFGHLEMAAGMPGLLKVVHALRHRRIPGNTHLGQLSSRIPWDELPVAVRREPQPWPDGAPRLAGVSAFGFSGTNAHLVLEEAPPEPVREANAAQPAHLLLLSARSASALAESARRLAGWLAERPEARLDEVCWTAATGRARLPHRLAVQASDPVELGARLAAFADAPDAPAPSVVSATAHPVERPLAFLFSGQGAQYAGMGRELHELHPTFRATLDRCEEILAPLLDAPLSEILWGNRAGALNQTGYTQPALVSLEVALAGLWQSWGVRPSHVMGHSVGEIAAACVAGILSLEDALRLAAARGRLMQALPTGGAMAIVLAGRDAVAPVVERAPDLLALAAFNAPEQTVLSGERSAVVAACAWLEAERGVRNRGLLDVSHAFHSPLMAPMLGELRAVVETIRFRPPEIEIVSNVTGRCESDRLASPDYWVEHVRAPVDFMAGLAELERAGVETLLEVGPGSTLVGLARASLRGDGVVTAASLRPRTSDWGQLLGCLGTLAVHGHEVDWRRAGRCDQPPPARLELPTYPFERRRYWFQDSGEVFSAGSAAPVAGGHPLLGRRLPTAALPEGDFLYEAALRPARPAYLEDHRVYDKVVVPAAAFVEMALAGIDRELPGVRAVLRDVSVQTALVLAAGRDTAVQTHFADAGAGRYRFRVFSAAHRADDGDGEASAWQTHVSGEIELQPADEESPTSLDLAALRRRADQQGEAVDVEAFYRRYASLGLTYGPRFRAVAELSRVERTDTSAAEVVARIRAPGLAPEELAAHVLHPVLLDGCLQAVGALVPGRDDVVCLPVGIESLRAWRPAPAALWVRAVLRDAEPGDPRIVADLQLLDEDGGLVAALTGLQAVPVERRALAYATATWKSALYAVRWSLEDRQPSAAPADEGPARESWIVLGDRGGTGARLAAAAEASGRRCRVIGEDDLDVRDAAAWTRLLDEHGEREQVPVTAVVHLLSLDEEGEPADVASLEAAQARLCGSALALVQAIMKRADQRVPRLWLVTRGAQVVADDESPAASQAPLWGLGRTLGHEHPSLRGTCVDLDARGAGPDEIDELAAEIAASDAELQVALRSGKRHVARLVRAAARSRRELSIGAGPFQLRTAEYGTFDHLAAVPCDRREPGDDEVEIEVRAAAINFKDVLHCLGMLKEWSERAGIERAVDQPLGFECAGRVVRVGAAVTGLSTGDEVFAMAPSAMASHVTLAARHVHRKPHNLSFEQSASLPAAFMTALHGLDDLARLKPGDRVLIHACAGGVGQAAVQVARARGAIVFGTASPGKWSHVQRQGVDHVMSSRTLDFADEILRLTDGRGVDVVLNSLAGEVIRRSADVLAPGGRFVEIGKIGIWTAAEMAAHRPDVAYFSFDLGDVDGEGALQARLLADVVRDLEAGRLAPLPVRVFPIEQAEEGFRHLARARNIGKVVLALPDRARPPGRLRSDRAYLVTGGLGALGLAVAQRLVAGGARQIALAGRSEPGEHARGAIEGLRAAGARVAIVAMDVADPAQLDDGLRRIAEEQGPLAGVVHAAGTLDDATIARQSWERFAGVMAAKVSGSWNLHRATLALDLDFFVLFSSAASVLGGPGQANYAAANAFLDALAQQRRRQGLPATCIHWGPWAAGGMAERTRAANRARFESVGLRRLGTDDNLEILEHLLEGRAAGAAVLDVDWGKYLKVVRNPGMARFYAALEGPGSAAGRPEIGSMYRRLAGEPEERREAILLDHLRGEIANVVGLASPDSIDAGQPLLSVGFDSLMAVELKGRIEASLGCALGPSLLFDHPTLEKLVRHLLHGVLHLAGEPGQTPAAAPVAAADPTVADVGAERGVIPLAGMRESFVLASEGRRVCVCQWGEDDAPLAVLVHGILDQAASWDEVAVGLVERGYRVVAPDLRGHGRSDPWADGAGVTAMDFLLDLTAAVGERERRPFLLVGHSIGAAVATLYASAFAERVAHLVLVEPVMPALREQHGAADLLRQDLRYARQPPAHTVHADLRAAADMLALGHREVGRARLTALARRITEPCDGGVRWIWDPRLRNPMGVDLSFSPSQYLELVRGLEIGSTRIYGASSQFAGTPILVPSELSGPGARIVTVPGGHNLHTEQPAAVLREILADADADRRSPATELSA